MKICKKCKKEISENAAFCPYCGADQREKKDSPIQYCTGCGYKLEEEYTNCPKCGKPIQKKIKSSTVKTDRKPETFYGINVKDIAYPKGFLKIIGIILGAIYAYITLTYLPYLSYYSAADKIWGVAMLITCAWCSFILFIIGFRCQKQYGLHLLYALAVGAVLKCILHIINIQRIARYEYLSGSSSKYLSIVGAVITVAVCWYAMKQEDMLKPIESSTFMQTVREIPGTLRSIFDGNSTVQFSNSNINIKSLKLSNPIEKPETEGEKILFIVCSNMFLALNVLYTINIAYDIFSSFAFFKLITEFFSIMTCIAIWMIFYNGRKGVLDAAGFSIVKTITFIRFIVCVLISLLLLSIVMLAGAGVGICLLVAVCMLVELYYWWSIWKLFSSMHQNAKGVKTEICAGIYPIFVLGINAIIKAGSFAVASFMQFTANNITGLLNQYSDDTYWANEILMDALGNEWGISSEVLRAIIKPVNEWIQSTLGFSQSPIIMIIVIAIPIIEILLLVKLRSLTETDKPVE